MTESFYPATDGATTSVKNLADALIDTGHQVGLFAPAPGLASYRGARVHRIRPYDRPGLQLRQALADFEPDLVHVTAPRPVGPHQLGRKALKQARRLGLPTVTVETSVPADAAADLWQRRIRDRSDALLVTSQWQLEPISALGGKPALWLPGVDTEAFRPELRDEDLRRSWAGKDGRRTVVGYVGSLHKRHGVRRLVELADLPGISLVIIGAGPQRTWLRRNLPKAKFVGEYETGHLALALASLDVLVHPGLAETSCHAHREAAASGIPVVAPRAGGARDVVRSLETGLLYDPVQPLGLRRAVEAVVGDRHRELLGRRARELQTRGWPDAAAELVDQHLEKAVAGRGRSVPADRTLRAVDRVV